MTMNPTELKGALEAIIYAADDPVTIDQLAAAIGEEKQLVRAALDELARRAQTNENLLPAILQAVEAYASVGEISDALRHVYGEYLESVVI